MSFDVLAEGLQFPEGPIAMPDGSVILVEIARGTLSRVWNGRTEVICDLGGGPNGAALGPDGHVYITNHGGGGGPGGVPGRPAIQGGIDRVDLATGKGERLFDKAGDHLLTAPNDLVFDRQGGFWFTDLGKQAGRVRALSGLYYVPPGGAPQEVSFGGTGYNGVGLSPDEATVYAAETYTGRLIAFDLAAPGQAVKGGRGGRLVGTAPGRAFFDSLAVQANGDVCVASIADGITTVTPSGHIRQTPIPDRMVTNICFGGADLMDAFITLSGDGRLIRMRWPEPGLRLNFSA